MAVGATAAALLVVALLVALLVLPGRGEDEGSAAPEGPPPIQPASLVGPAEERIDEVLDQFDRSTTVAQISAAGDAAKAVTDEIETSIAKVDRVEGARRRTATREVLEHLSGIAYTMSGLSGFDGENLTQWAMISTAAHDHGDGLDEPMAVLSSAGSYTSDGEVVEHLSSTRASLDLTIKAINGKLVAWKEESRRIEEEKAQGLQALDSYEGQTRSQLSRYSGLRQDLQDFIDRVDTVGATFDEAYAFFGSAASDRQSVRTALAGITPPGSITSAHSGLVAVIDTAIGAINDGLAGIREYQYDYYFYYKDTPSWQTFVSKSSQITDSYDAAIDAWNGAVQAERARLEGLAPPPRPNV